jgi:hypothetical protein
MAGGEPLSLGGGRKGQRKSSLKNKGAKFLVKRQTTGG